MTPIEYIWYN